MAKVTVVADVVILVWMSEQRSWHRVKMPECWQLAHEAKPRARGYYNSGGQRVKDCVHVGDVEK